MFLKGSDAWPTIVIRTKAQPDPEIDLRKIAMHGQNYYKNKGATRSRLRFENIAMHGQPLLYGQRGKQIQTMI